MNIGWQDVVAIGLVVAAAAIVVRRLWRVGSGRRSPGCAACPARGTPSEQQRLISIDPPPPKQN